VNDTVGREDAVAGEESGGAHWGGGDYL
jgi:hypothetical protein